MSTTGESSFHRPGDLQQSTMPEDLASALQHWDASAVPIARLSGGNRSDVWRIDINGERWTARRSSRSHDALAWELDLIEHLASQGIGVPRLLRTLEGQRSYDGVCVLSWIDGHSPTTEREWRNIADELKRVHQLTPGWPQRPAFASSQDLLTDTSGGDVDLSVMPYAAVVRCRAAWNLLLDEPTSAIHGDPRGNALITDAGVAFIDWDEARVDASVLDLVDLPHSDKLLRENVRERAQQAASAWEAAVSWTIEPDYARRRLSELSDRS